MGELDWVSHYMKYKNEMTQLFLKEWLFNGSMCIKCVAACFGQFTDNIKKFWNIVYIINKWNKYTYKKNLKAAHKHLTLNEIERVMKHNICREGGGSHFSLLSFTEQW